MKKISLKSGRKSVSAEFEDETMLDEVLHTVGGLIKALGYCYDGQIEVVEPPDFEDGAMDIPKKRGKK
jgi:hypothetical protein